MAIITYPTDFLNSDLRQGVLYQLTISLATEITEMAFRSIITQLNIKFISPRVAFSGLWTPQKLTIFYSTSDWSPTISQKDIVFSLTDAFSLYHPQIVFEESEGEVPGGLPIISPKGGEYEIFSLKWWKQTYEDFVKTVSEATGLPKDKIPWIFGGSLLVVTLLVLWLKTKPIIIIEKES